MSRFGSDKWTGGVRDAVRVGCGMGRNAGGGGVARGLLRRGSGVVAAMLNFTASPFWSRKVRLAVLTLATFIALC